MVETELPTKKSKLFIAAATFIAARNLLRTRTWIENPFHQKCKLAVIFQDHDASPCLFIDVVRHTRGATHSSICFCHVIRTSLLIHSRSTLTDRFEREANFHNAFASHSRRESV